MTTNIRNTKTISKVILKSDLEEESIKSNVQSPEDDDEEFTPKEIQMKKPLPAKTLPKRRGRTPKHLQVITKPVEETVVRKCGRPRKKPQVFAKEESPVTTKKRGTKLKGK